MPRRVNLTVEERLRAEYPRSFLITENMAHWAREKLKVQDRKELGRFVEELTSALVIETSARVWQPRAIAALLEGILRDSEKRYGRR